MNISTNTYQVRTATFTEENLKSILSYAVDFNPRFVTISVKEDGYNRVELEEKIMNLGLGRPASVDLTETHIRYVISQLDSWAGSSASGNAMAERAAKLIRLLAEKIEDMEKAGVE